MRTFGTHGTVIIWERTAERGKVFTLNTRIWVESFTVNTMLGGRMIRNLWVCAMTTQFVSVIYPPAVTVFRIVARVIVRASAYFAYSVLFSIPLIGLILLIVFSFSDANINRRNFARSYLIGLAVAIVLTIVLVLTGTLARAMNSMDAEYIQNLLKSMPKA